MGVCTTERGDLYFSVCLSFALTCVNWRSAADVKMEIPVLVRSLKSSILSSTSFQMGKAFWGVVSVAVEQSRGKANMVAQGDGKFDP